MKRIALVVALLICMGSTVNGGSDVYESCVETLKGATAFYSERDFIVSYKLMHEVSHQAYAGAVAVMLDSGRAIPTHGMKFGLVVVTDDIAKVTLPNGKSAWTLSGGLRCK